MINEKVAKLINEQITKELYSAYLYLAFANFLEDEGLGGFASWYVVQAKEEVEHGMKMREYLIDNGIKVELGAIDEPKLAFKNVEEVLKAGLKHEEYVTSLINAIYDAAWEVKEYKTMQFLDWFVKEQVEEEKNANDLLSKYQLFVNNKQELYHLDKELKERK